MKSRISQVTTGFAGGLICFAMGGPAMSAPSLSGNVEGDQPGSLRAMPVSETAKLQLPESVDRGQAMTVTVPSGHSDGRLEVWGPTGTATAGRTVAEFPVIGGVASLISPAEAGSYEVRFYDTSGRLQGAAELEVASSPVTLSTPEPIGVGYDTRIHWTGPAALGDTIRMVDPVNGAMVSEAPALGEPGVRNTTVLRAPERAGEYIVQYWSSRGTVLAELPASVGEGIAWLRLPTEVVAGTVFTAEWHGPGDPAYEYQIVEPETGGIIDAIGAQMSADGTVLAVNLTAPAKPGDYRVRVVNSSTGFVLSDLPLDVDPE